MNCKGNCGQWGLVALRLSAGVIFIASGWMKLHNIEMIGGMFGGLGIPAAGVMAWVVALLEFIGGIALVAGIWVQGFAWPLAFVMLVALLTAHRSGPFMGAYGAFSLLGSLIALGTLGGGACQLVKRPLCKCANGKGCNCGTDEVKKA